MDQLIQNHKKLLMFFGGGLVLVLTLHFMFVEPQFARAAKLNKQWGGLKAALNSSLENGMPTESAMQAAQADTESLQADLRSHAAKFEFAFGPGFEMNEGAKKDPVFFYQTRKHEVKRDLDKLASQKDIKIPADLGFPPQASEKIAQDLLYRLGVLDFSIQTALNSGVTEVTGVASIDVSAMMNAEPSGFIQYHPAGFSIRGSAESVMKTLHALQQPPKYLVIREFKITNEDPLVDELTATFKVAGLVIEVDSELGEAEVADVGEIPTEDNNQSGGNSKVGNPADLFGPR